MGVEGEVVLLWGGTGGGRKRKGKERNEMNRQGGSHEGTFSVLSPHTEDTYPHKSSGTQESGNHYPKEYRDPTSLGHIQS